MAVGMPEEAVMHELSNVVHEAENVDVTGDYLDPREDMRRRRELEKQRIIEHNRRQRGGSLGTTESDSQQVYRASIE